MSKMFLSQFSKVLLKSVHLKQNIFKKCRYMIPASLNLVAYITISTCWYIIYIIIFSDHLILLTNTIIDNILILYNNPIFLYSREE